MLRRKLILNLCPLVALLLLTGVLAIYLLQGVLRDIREINVQSWRAVEDVNELGIVIGTIQSGLTDVHDGPEQFDTLSAELQSARALTDSVGRSRAVAGPEARALSDGIAARLEPLAGHLDGLSSASHDSHLQEALALTVQLRRDTLDLSRRMRGHAHAEQEALAAWFRWVVLGLAVVFVILVNASVAILIRMAVLILRPVNKLVEATTELGKERFETRVSLDERDEFDQLAQAYNSLAEHLQTTEQRRMEVLGQVALAMNHELNNTIAIIELQLELLNRKTHGDPALERCLREINQSLVRMTRAVQNLRNVRRIVLTDYIPGQKMLDLERSITDDDGDAPAGLRSADDDREQQSAPAPAPVTARDAPVVRAQTGV